MDPMTTNNYLHVSTKKTFTVDNPNFESINWSGNPISLSALQCTCALQGRAIDLEQCATVHTL
jgi:hypothetical protein